MLEETHKFYEKLYSKDSNTDKIEEKMKVYLHGLDHKILSQENKESCEEIITVEEMGRALKTMKNNSSPGSDGITAEFYKTFWRVLKTPLFNSYAESIQEGELTLSQRRGIIALIHKGNNTCRRNLNNWRCITPINVDYKIFTKMPALRLQKVIKSIVHENQSGFISGRKICSHIRLLDDIIRYTGTEKTEGIVVSLDYKKAFDSVYKEAILAALKEFNFGPNFIKYIETILSNTESATKKGVWMSKFNKTEKGVRQGCNVSPLLFVLVVEILAIKLRSNENIRGIFNDGALEDKLKLLHYGDGMTLVVKNQEDLRTALAENEFFTSISGLQLNRKKSTGMWIGKSKGNEARGEGITWLDKNLKVLGIYTSTPQTKDPIFHKTG
ncbi:retrovirus-related Pol polyprotein from type-1 retrotransposable element R2 [Elysia marginata]|uniref:Retrovirus-related Pol polyprotein from type-1 retrotransposable element R2 n=1 Tax=Elysia marginata TaxID=1093978 RepID=A0AAV4IKG6_9GAST|nr:retrovirus-related Pol polyprotein from type-1 retrotransposable element R2 [Elysia marginata]